MTSKCDDSSPLELGPSSNNYIHQKITSNLITLTKLQLPNLTEPNLKYDYVLLESNILTLLTESQFKLTDEYLATHHS